MATHVLLRLLIQPSNGLHEQRKVMPEGHIGERQLAGRQDAAADGSREERARCVVGRRSEALEAKAREVGPGRESEELHAQQASLRASD